MTKTFTKTTPEQRKAAVDAGLAEMHAQVAKITTSDEWLAWLRIAAKFHRYSLGNLMWMTAQAEARGLEPLTHVAGFSAWLKFNRGVKKGEKSLKVLAPMVVAKKPGDKGYNPLVRTTKVIGFKIESVFDVQQTEGEPLPESPKFVYPDGEVPEGLVEALVAFSGANGYPVRSEPTVLFGEGPDAYTTNKPAKKIAMGKHLEGLDARYFGTLIHEVAHSLLHQSILDGEQSYELHRGVTETEAESVAFIVGEHFGVQMNTESFHYVAGWSKDPEAVIKSGNRITRVARQIIDAAEETLSAGE